MADNPTPQDIDLETFLKTAGQSFTAAQKSLLPEVDVPVNMMLSNAELELKVAVSSDARGRMLIRPISSDDISRGGIDTGLISTLHISYISSIGEVKPQTLQSVESYAQGTVVPALTGLTLDQAAALLKAHGWLYEAHAAASREVVAAGSQNSGRVLRQQPPAGKFAEKSKDLIEFWVDLGNLSVTEIDGVGVKYAKTLSGININSLGELSLADSGCVASALRVSPTRAQTIIDMAGLMSRLSILGYKDEVVELIVKAAGINSIEQLAKSDPAELFRVCQSAVVVGKVRVPAGFKFTLNDTRSWIKTAGSYLP